MNSTENGDKCCGRSLSITVAVVVACLIFAALVWKMQEYTTPAPIGAQRMAERSKALGELRGAEADALNTAGWVDQSKGLVRLPIEEAKKLAEREWQNPAQARSNLIARVEKATFVPPPPPNPLE